MDQSGNWRPLAVPSEEFEQFRHSHLEVEIIDQTRLNLEELFLLRNPKYKFDRNYQAPLEEFLKERQQFDFGNWFYFPWSRQLVRYLPEAEHFELRTGRNKNLITNEEQKRFYDSTIVCLGLSVGSHAAVMIALTGGGRRFKLADPDKLSGDNLNRLRAGFADVGVNKAVLAARQIFTLNPYAEIECYDSGLTEENAAAILDDGQVLIEEMDNPYWKLRARELARERKIPVLMGTDNGDGAIVDIERFDLEPNLSLLNGLAGELSAEGLKAMPPADLPKVAAKIAGEDLAVPRMLESVREVGKSLYSWPQLGTAANLCGSILAYLARRIILGDQGLKSGRYEVAPEKIFE